MQSTNQQPIIAGVDEAGRGPLAGPVSAAAVVLDPQLSLAGLDDSKKLSETKRIRLEKQIKDTALYWSVAYATVEEIDELNILHASMLAMRRAVSGLGVLPKLARVDGNRDHGLSIETQTVVGGDALHPEISAASILAKQARDRLMVALSRDYPAYGFERHKGYPTKAHVAALQQHGVTIHHRRSFAPVRAAMGEQ
ncbi:MAG: ribonuclease HII [Acidiferrobacterales bacterium]|nr:ribonuclease HII [Acidiferrobacterales bacterium]